MQYQQRSQKLPTIYGIPLEPWNLIEEEGQEGAIFLGDIQSAQDLNFLRNNNIKAVLTVAKDSNLSYNKNDIKFHEILEAQDQDNFDLYPFFDQAFQFIDSVHKSLQKKINKLKQLKQNLNRVYGQKQGQIRRSKTTQFGLQTEKKQFAIKKQQGMDYKHEGMNPKNRIKKQNLKESSYIRAFQKSIPQYKNNTLEDKTQQNKNSKEDTEGRKNKKIVKIKKKQFNTSLIKQKLLVLRKQLNKTKIISKQIIIGLVKYQEIKRDYPIVNGQLNN